MGHATDEVYKFVNKNSYRKIFAMQGKSGAGKPIAGRAFQNKKYKIYLHQVGTDGAKDLIYSRLSIKDN
jgi:phage terminase large subunit GpA-like protein